MRGGWAIALVGCWIPALAAQGRPTTEVLVLGTIHGMNQPGCTFGNLMDVFDAVAPEALAVEIRPEALASGDLLDGPIEMSLLVYLARQRSLPVAGIDWWRTADFARFLAERPVDEPAREQEELAAAEREFGPESPYDLFRINGPAWTELMRREHDIAIRYEGDRGNWGWTQRNLWMAHRLARFVSQHRGRRILVAVGAEHRYFLLDELRREPDVKLLDLESFAARLPAKPSRSRVPDGVVALWTEGVQRLQRYALRLGKETPLLAERLARKLRLVRAIIHERGACCAKIEQ